MVIRSPSPLDASLAYHLLGCLTGITFNVFSINLPLRIIKKLTIKYFSFPFCTRDDEDESDVEFDDERNIVIPPYPSYHWDFVEARVRQRLEAEERDQAILTWNVTTATANDDPTTNDDSPRLRWWPGVDVGISISWNLQLVLLCLQFSVCIFIFIFLNQFIECIGLSSCCHNCSRFEF